MEKKKDIIIVLLVIIIAILCLVIGVVLGSKITDNNKGFNNTNNSEKLLSEQEAYSIGNELYDYAISALSCNEYEYADPSFSNYVDGLGYEVLNYQEVRSKFTQNNQVQKSLDQSYEAFDSEITELNGKYYDPSNCGRGADQTYISTELELVKIENDKITFNANTKYCDDTSEEIYSDITKCNIFKNETHEFVIEKEKNIWKIAKVTNPK